MNKRFLYSILTILVVLIIAGVAIFFVKGYTFSSKDGRLSGTGILSITSMPDGASVYINGHLTTATNTTLSSLQPKKYQLKIVKEAFIPWEKEVEVVEGLVTEVKATLFPAIPTIYPLTVNGAINPALSPDGDKLVFAVPFIDDSHSRQKGGIWVWTMGSQPISFARGAEPHQLVASSFRLDFSKAKIIWSPDSKQVLLTLQENNLPGEANLRNYLLDVDKQTNIADLKDITPILDTTEKEWALDQKIKDEARISTIKDLRIKEIASSSSGLVVGSSLTKTPTPNNEQRTTNLIKWSPDETKFIKGSKLYDLSSKNTPAKQTSPAAGKVLLGSKEYDLPPALDYFWLPDSKHIILVGEEKISISEIDGANISEIYAGKFDGTTVFPWPDSSKMVILTSYNTSTASTPNLFGINLK